MAALLRLVAVGLCARFASAKCVRGDCTSGKGKRIYDTGDVYDGEWKGRIRHGKGTYTSSNGDVYKGEWKFDSQSGHGEKSYANGEVYKGEWEMDLTHGNGRHTWPDGSIYDGHWVAGTQKGRGNWTWPDGAVYLGMIAEGQPHGRGKITYADGSVHDGTWKAGKVCCPGATLTEDVRLGILADAFAFTLKQLAGGKPPGVSVTNLSSIFGLGNSMLYVSEELRARLPESIQGTVGSLRHSRGRLARALAYGGPATSVGAGAVRGALKDAELSAAHVLADNMGWLADRFVLLGLDFVTSRERRTHVAFCAGEVLSSRRVNSPIATLLPPLSRFLDYRDSVVTLQNNAKVRMHCQNHWQGPSHKKDLLGAIVVNYGRRLRNAVHMVAIPGGSRFVKPKTSSVQPANPVKPIIDYEKELTALYTKHSPNKVGTINALLEKYSRNKDALLRSVRAKYEL